MRFSLSHKVFIGSLAAFLLIIGLTVVTFMSYFSFFYEKDKIKSVVSEINAFVNDYENNDWGREELYQQIIEFNNYNNLDMWVYDYSGAGSLGSIYSGLEKIASTSGVYYYVEYFAGGLHFYSFLSTDDYFKLQSEGALKVDQTIRLEGFTDNYSFVIVESINGTSLDSFNNYMNEVSSDTLSPFGKTVNVSKVHEIRDTTTKMNTSITPSDNEIVLDGVTYARTAVPFNEYHDVTFSKLLFRADGIQEIYTTLSLHSVHEINQILMTYVPWFVIVALILSTILALVYSKFVSRPILNIANAAKQMSLQDFEVILDTERNDELGALAVSLKRMSEDLRRALESLVVQNAQLEHDFTLKSNEEEARKAFIANASHELKTPIGVIKSYVEAIIDGVKVEKQSYYLSVIEDEANHMETLVKEMIMLSKFEGDVHYQSQIVPLDQLISSVVSTLKSKLDSRSINVEIKSDLGTIIGDRDKLNQVFTNLVDNVAKYGDKHSTFYIESIHKPDYIELFFKNDCPHFSEEDLKKVWNRFYKIDTSHTRSIEGSGLGLPIVKSILERHGSEFGVYNTRNGVCFHMSFKRITPE